MSVRNYVDVRIVEDQKHIIANIIGLLGFGIVFRDLDRVAVAHANMIEAMASHEHRQNHLALQTPRIRR